MRPVAVMDWEGDIADMHFDELSEMQLEPFAYCFQDANRHRIDNVVAAMLGLNSQLDAQLDPPADIKDMLARWRWLFCNEPTVRDHSNQIRLALAAYAAGGEPQSPQPCGRGMSAGHAKLLDVCQRGWRHGESKVSRTARRHPHT